MLLHLSKRLCLSIILVLASAMACQANDGYDLPSIGGAGGGLISPAQERQLGRDWLRMFRSQAPVSNDALLIDYTEQLLAKLVQTSQLTDRRLSVVMVKNPTMNAFAVPGGVVGVHTGLFLYAENEHQMASVLTHELAHLSLRHFARRLEKQKNASVGLLAAQLASLVLLATAGTDVGLAAMSATQAAALDSQLRYSRQNEQEADRVGITNLAAAGMDPRAAPEMFEQMLKGSRYTRRPPEFLLTHPVTEKRISDSRNRAERYPRKSFNDSVDYHFMKARIILAHSETPQKAVKRFDSELRGDSHSMDASRYGLVLALTESGQAKRALEELKPLREKYPNKPAIIIAQAEAELRQGQFANARNRIKKALDTRPYNAPLTLAYAKALSAANDFKGAEQVLLKFTRKNPEAAHAWYELAEVHGLTDNTLGLHKARAEYFILNGIFDKAQHQLTNALKLTDSFHETALLEERLRQVQAMQERRKI